MTELERCQNAWRTCSTLSMAARWLNVDSPGVDTGTARGVPRWLCAQEMTLRKLERAGGGVRATELSAGFVVTAGAEPRGVVYVRPLSYNVLVLSLEEGMKGKIRNKRSSQGNAEIGDPDFSPSPSNPSPKHKILLLNRDNFESLSNAFDVDSGVHRHL